MRQSLSLLFLLGCAPGVKVVSSSYAPTPISDPCWMEVEDVEACVTRTEAGLLARTSGRAERQGDRLLIHTRERFHVPLADRGEDPESYLSYRYHGYLEPLLSHLVAVSFYEGCMFVLVDERSGNQTHVMGHPAVSPDGGLFATSSLDMDAGYNPNGIEVWRTTEHGPRLEWRLEGGDSWDASDLLWRGEDVLEFTRHTYSPSHEGLVEERMRLQLRPDGLQLERIDD